MNRESYFRDFFSHQSYISESCVDCYTFISEISMNFPQFIRNGFITIATEDMDSCRGTPRRNRPRKATNKFTKIIRRISSFRKNFSLTVRTKPSQILNCGALHKCFNPKQGRGLSMCVKKKQN
jgi:hypothetical protein